MPVIVGLVVFFVLALGGTYVWAIQYDGKIAPNVWIGPVDVGGMDPEIARHAIQTKIDAILTNGINVRVNDQEKMLTLATFISGDLIEDVEYSLDPAIEQAKIAGRSWMLLESLFGQTRIQLKVTVSQENIKQSVHRQFPDTEVLSENASFVFSLTDSNWSVSATAGAPGREFEWEPFFATIQQQLAELDVSLIELSLLETSPRIGLQNALSQIDSARAILLKAPLTFSYTDERVRDHKWTLSQNQLSMMLVPTAKSEPQINQEAFDDFLDPIASELERATQNARIEVENGRVVEFVESKAGLRLDREQTYQRFVEKFNAGSEDPAYQVIFNTEDPAVKTGDVNDLGIDQILGTGTSSYRGSPTNRKKNIQNGVRLLNGLLIPPGETFSLINALKPFETDNGYLPELVIKGNEIVPELGGGLCQIGTTTFRAAMNSGLPIVERRNHSLVVSYYNDPANNNPGTDATIYEPAPDFKFLNDTGHYLLFQAENLVDTQELRFTFWGTSDGRKGSYLAPIVERWIPVGETQYIESTNLEPGKEKCQEAHIGADANFAYTIIRPDGTEEKTVFTSHYRPLPRICLVGVEQITEELSTENLAEENGVE